jgi:LPPG:FO 2-phospho-L-lactate transferase
MTSFKVVALAGGVGGAKLVDGLAQILPAGNLTVIVNTGDDFEHLGLWVCPDLDTVCYTLAGIANPETGWGRLDETWHVMENLGELGGPTWFHLGDQDIATHLERTRRLNRGQTLSQVTQVFCQAWGINHTILPMSDTPVSTLVTTDRGILPFQEYFVRRRCEPEVRGFSFDRVEDSRPAPGMIKAIQEATLVIICPSNPWVSIDPILAVSDVRKSLEKKCVIAVSPIIGGKAVKGPAAKMYQELGIRPSALAVALHYLDLVSGFVFDKVDEDQVQAIRDLGIEPLVTSTLMKISQDRRKLAEDVIAFGQQKC